MYKRTSTIALYMLAYFVVMCCNENVVQAKDDGAEKKQDADRFESQISPLELYRHLFKEKRKSHSQAVRAILNIEKYEKQYSMLKVILDKMFSTTREAKVVLMESGYTPGDPFPTEEKLREVLSMIVENTVFFGDILLHLPDITHDLLKRNNEWNVIARWSISFANDTKIYEEKEGKLLNLMAQELSIVDKDPDYINPYKAPEKDLKEEIERIMKDSMAEAKLMTQKQLKKKKEKKKKGPRLSNIRHNEL